MALPASRLLFCLAALVCAGLMGFALFLQHGQALAPCPLCLSQRLVVITIGSMALLATVHNPGYRGYRVYGGLVSLLGLAGLALAGRQLWLQQLSPEQTPACMPNVEYLIESLPWSELVHIMLTGTGDCADVQWTLGGLSIPAWTLLCFAAFMLWGLVELCRKKVS